MQEQYSRAVNRHNSFSARLDDVLARNKTLREGIKDYERGQAGLLPGGGRGGPWRTPKLHLFPIPVI